MSRRKVYDFGFDPREGGHHFQLLLDKSGAATLIEQFAWNGEAQRTTPALNPQVKAQLDPQRWARVAPFVAEQFNARLRRARIRAARWKRETLLAPHFGKELALLMWATEDMDLALIPNILTNWAGFAPEERWWLYTTINATIGHAEHGQDRGWRKAIKIALAENPTNGRPPSALAYLHATPEEKERASRRAGDQLQLPFDATKCCMGKGDRQR